MHQPRPTLGSGAAAGRRLLLAVTALAAVVLSLIAADAVAGGPASVPSSGAVGGPIRWGGCDPPGPRLQCARIRVPLDWDHPNGRTIQLAVIRHLASKPGRADRLAVHQPGRTGRHRRRSGAGLWATSIDTWGGGRFDVVSWDPRGTNASTRVHCFTSERSEASFWKGDSIPTTRGRVGALSAQDRRPGARAAARSAAGSCPTSRPPTPPATSTTCAACVGERKLTYVGLSYGTYLGQTYANMFPDRVRAMLLDGIVDPVPYSKGAEARVASQASRQR